MVDKLKQSNLWNTFTNWYYNNQDENGIWLSTEQLEIYNTIFTNLVFVKFLEDYYEGILERMYIKDSGMCYSLLNETTYEAIVFGKYCGFYTLEELILAAFEDE